jgi:hypothetical protein
MRKFLTVVCVGTCFAGYLGACSGEGAGANASCGSTADCVKYGATATCQDGTCVGMGLTCAKRAGLDPGARFSADVPETTAALYDEWLSKAGAIVGAYCNHLSTCQSAGAGNACTEGAPDPTTVSCCRVALEAYVGQRAGVQACQTAGASCDAVTLEAFCAPAATVLAADCGRD